MDLPPVTFTEQSVIEAAAPLVSAIIRPVIDVEYIPAAVTKPDDSTEEPIDTASEQPVGVELQRSSNKNLPEVVDVADASSLFFDGSLNMGGLFYGMPGSGWKTGNAPISVQSARRFMAERTGDVIAVRHDNRTLSDSNINDRCASDPGSVWCKCKDADLDKYTCGYTLSNSYSVGNGGSILVEIRTDDGSDDHAPSETVLGTAAKPYVPMEIASNQYPEIALAEPVRLEAGRLYHLVYRNLNPPDGCKLKGVAISEAAACPRDQGAIALNGVTHHVDVGPTARFGPFLGSSPAVLYRSSSSDSWRTSDTVTSWYELKYSDGSWLGDTVVAYDAHRGGGVQTVRGDVRARQVFTVTDVNRKVNGVWLNHGHSSSADDSDLLVQLKDADGQVLSQGEIPVSRECLDIVETAENSYEKGCRAWGYTELSPPVDLLPGSSYSVELSTSSKGGYSLSTYFTLKHYGSKDRNGWSDAHAELSRDGGAGWSQWTSSYPERDLPLLLTIDGQPKQLR